MKITFQKIESLEILFKMLSSIDSGVLVSIELTVPSTYNVEIINYEQSDILKKMRQRISENLARGLDTKFKYQIYLQSEQFKNTMENHKYIFNMRAFANLGLIDNISIDIIDKDSENLETIQGKFV